jgi:hypothetical protein
LTVVSAAAVAITSGATRMRPWKIFAFGGERYELRALPAAIPLPAVASPSLQHPATPPEWYIPAAVLDDVTGDGLAEWVLLVWRRWGDWPIQRWVPVPSPIVGYHDDDRQSCHVILLDARDGREIWAGSALPVPFVALTAGDVDGDGVTEIVTLEGDYGAGRTGPGTRIDIWGWNGFGFDLEWRSPPGRFHELRLTDAGNGGILAIAVR